MPSNQSLMQRPVPWAVSFLIASAAVGPVLFAPPWTDRYRRQQQLAFGIGIVSWSLCATWVLGWML